MRALLCALLFAGGCYDFSRFDRLPADQAVPLGDGGGLVDGAMAAGDAAACPGRMPTWAPLTSGVTFDLHGIWKDPSGALYAVGKSGTLVVSNDAGKSWLMQSIAGGADLYALWGSPAGDLYAVGTNGAIWHRAPGLSFVSQSVAGLTSSFNGVWGSGNDVFVVGSDGLIYHAPLGGASFTKQTSGTTSQLEWVWGMGNEYYAVGSALLHTTDGGAHWTGYDFTAPPDAGIMSVNDLYTVAGDSLESVWAAGDNGNLIHTVDHGKNWTTQVINSGGYLFSLWITKGALYAVGENGSIAYSSDGVSWMSQTVPNLAGTGFYSILGDSCDIYTVGFGGAIYHRGR